MPGCKRRSKGRSFADGKPSAGCCRRQIGARSQACDLIAGPRTFLAGSRWLSPRYAGAAVVVLSPLAAKVASLACGTAYAP